MRNLYLIFPVVVTIVWNILDASPALYLYDKFLLVSTLNSNKARFRSLKGKTIWISGSSSGIGAEIVCKLVEAEVGHVIMSSRRIDKMEQVSQKCQEKFSTSESNNNKQGAGVVSMTTKISIVPYDALNRDDKNYTKNIVTKVLSLVDDNDNESGKIDMLILNAGIYQNKPAVLTTIEETNQIMRVNFEAPVELSTTLIELDQWKRQPQQQPDRVKQHRILVVASVMSRGSHSLSSTYAASKHALRGYFHSLSTEEGGGGLFFSPSWLRIDIACPATTKTDFWKNSNSSNSGQLYGPAMSPERVAQLLLTGITGPYLLFYETWICETTGLLWLWMSSYTPTLFHVFIHFLGYIRVPIWYKEKLDVLDLPKLLITFVDLLLGRY